MSVSSHEVFKIPQAIIQLDSISDLPELENAVASTLVPAMTATQANAWKYRPDVRAKMYPPKFNGRLTDVVLTMMESPYEELLQARDHGWMLPGAHYERPAEVVEDLLESYIGFTLCADARSTGRGVIGQVRSALWYMRITNSYKTPNGGLVAMGSSAIGGSPVHRVVAKPQFNRDAFIKADSEARRAGQREIRKSIRYSYKRGMLAPNPPQIIE